MSEELQFTENFIKEVHPAKRGWALSRNVEIDGYHIHYLFERAGRYSVVITRFDNVVVTEAEMQHVIQIKAQVQQKYQSQHVRLLVIYASLLMPPPECPEHIVFMALNPEPAYNSNYLEDRIIN